MINKVDTSRSIMFSNIRSYFGSMNVGVRETSILSSTAITFPTHYGKHNEHNGDAGIGQNGGSRPP